MLAPDLRDWLFVELDHWQTGEATFWWRDDDAVSDTPQLHRLILTSINAAAPVGLAVIPRLAERQLVAAISGWRLATVWQHGFAHVNHALADEKKSELGDHRPVDVVLKELVQGRARLEKLFGDRFEPVLVPPWNRIGTTVGGALAEAEFRRVSTYGPQLPALDGTCQVNCHVDIIDWRGSRGYVGDSAAVGAVVAHLKARRSGQDRAAEPTGLLSHHLVHDAGCWDFLENLFSTLSGHPAAKLLSPHELPWHS